MFIHQPAADNHNEILSSFQLGQAWAFLLCLFVCFMCCIVFCCLFVCFEGISIPSYCM